MTYSCVMTDDITLTYAMTRIPSRSLYRAYPHELTRSDDITLTYDLTRIPSRSLYRAYPHELTC